MGRKSSVDAATHRLLMLSIESDPISDDFLLPVARLRSHEITHEEACCLIGGRFRS